MTIVYVYDALCGWCYGFSSVIMKLQNEYKTRLSFEVVSGGMITGSRVGPIGEVASYIQSAYKTVEATCGVRFGDGFLKHTLAEGTAIFTSIPPAIALSIVKQENPEYSLAFSTALQRAIYDTGRSPEDLETYGSLASEFGFDAKRFVENMQNPFYLALAKQDFKTSIDLGVNGFPTVFVAQGGKYTKVSSGYLPYDQLERKILSLNHD